MNTTPTEPADAPVPSEGTEQAAQAADQAAKQQQPPPESSTIDTVASVVDGVTDVASIAIDILSIFE